MTQQHHAAAIVPAHDFDASTAFYGRRGFEVVSDPSGVLIRIGCVLG